MAVFDKSNPKRINLDDTQKLSCLIEAAENTQDHTVYLLRCYRNSIVESTWQVWRRYSDFSSLHTCLQSSGIDALILPPKKVFGKMDREFIAERQQGLQNYINFVVSHPVLSMCLNVKRFLDPQNYDMNFLEKALQHVSMIFRSESHWEVVEPLPELGLRFRKQYFLVKPKIDPKERLLLYWAPFGPDKYLSDKDLQNAIKVLSSMQHPYLYPSAYLAVTDTGGVAIRDFQQLGSLRDIICKCKPKGSFIKKYANRSKTEAVLSPEYVGKFGRQILTILKFLHDKGFGHGHLHSGNVIIENETCRLTDVENNLLGLPAFLRPFIIQLRRVQTLENIDVYSFGHLLYEMSFGQPCSSPTCDQFPPSCPAQLRSVLEAILTTEACKNGLPSIADLLLHPFFKSSESEVKVSCKVSSQMKESLKKAREQLEQRLKEEQKVLRHKQHLSKVQAELNSGDQRKKRLCEKKKQNKQNEPKPLNGEPSNVPTPSPTPSTPSAGSPIPPPPIPPPPPMLPPVALPSSPTGSGQISSDRSALLGSIANFNANKLKKTITKDKSQPIL